MALFQGCVLILFGCFVLKFADGLDGYSLAESEEDSCPPNKVITDVYSCKLRNGDDGHCIKKSCCSGYHHVDGRCVSNAVDVCEDQPCEQQCTNNFGRVLCTCFPGFTFDRKRFNDGTPPYCVDLDECKYQNGGCSHHCNNTNGSYHCYCPARHLLKENKKTCELDESLPVLETSPVQAQSMPDEHREAGGRGPISRSRACTPSCDDVHSMKDTIVEIHEKMTLFEVMANSPPLGPSGPTGPPGPRGLTGAPGRQGEKGFPGLHGLPGPQGPMGPPGPPGPGGSSGYGRSRGSSTSATQIGKRGRRGQMGKTGPRGSPGIKGDKGDNGPRGEKGSAGSMDFILLIMAGLRRDVTELQKVVFKDRVFNKVPPVIYEEGIDSNDLQALELGDTAKNPDDYDSSGDDSLERTFSFEDHLIQPPIRDDILTVELSNPSEPETKEEAGEEKEPPVDSDKDTKQLSVADLVPEVVYVQPPVYESKVDTVREEESRD
ncbi:collagen and calcium-binding EGF domain-containing protein 1-like isoform X2 [Ptychodera flava]|uniref:collagen and calcium-binding EGF domain-containing protein 1-like isoform X2 n=1 Tax=Ptychodera flava TaxID=63121 RepID=UPI00396A80A1